MTVYRKCRPCKHRDDCEIKRSLAEAIKGFGVGTISHRCRSYEPDFEPGDNIWVAACAYPHSHEDAYYGGTPPVAQFPAHFVSYSKTLGRAVVFIEPGVKSRCGEYEFEPANGKEGFCKVSYAPYRAKLKYSIDKGIIDRRDGRTVVNSCCGRPKGKTCYDCAWLREVAA